MGIFFLSNSKTEKYFNEIYFLSILVSVLVLCAPPLNLFDEIISEQTTFFNGYILVYLIQSHPKGEKYKTTKFKNIRIVNDKS